jgi:hypothetical protein
MTLPLPRVVSDVGPGGGLVTAMGGINALNNDMLLRKINSIKAQYAPLTSQADAASKLAYANLMGPQFLAKLLQNPGALANMGDKQAREALLKSVNAGMGGGSVQNYLNNIQDAGVGHPSTNSFSGQLKNTFMNLIGKNSSQGNNPFSQLAQSLPQQQMPTPESSMSQTKPRGGVMLRGEQWYDKNGDPVYEEEVERPGKPTIELELTKGQEPTWAEKTGRFKGEEKQGEEGGKYRAKAQQEIGDSQLGLSHSGAVLNRLTDIVKNPVFQEMRAKIPFFQDKQLNYLLKTGTPEQKKLIGDFLSTSESFIASTVQGFGGRPLVREFDLAQRQKISPNDPVHVAEGKLESAIALHDIAEKKNDIISNLLDNGVNLSDAVKQANKMVDVSAIERRTQELLRDKPTEEDINYMAQKYKTTPEKIIKKLKAQGVL